MNIFQLSTEPKTPSIMIVDDTPANLKLLKEMLNRLEYKVSTFTTGRGALSSLGENIPNIILLDISMPDMDGFEVCRRIKSDPNTQGIPIIFISALNEMKDKVTAFRAGAVDYITKPFDFEEVRMRVNTHLTMHFYRLEIENMNRQLSKRVAEQVERLLQTERRYVCAQESIITGLAKLTESRDTDTGGHLERVSEYCIQIARNLAQHAEYKEKITEEFLTLLRQTAALHDIGKVGIVDSILLKNGRLTEEEFEQMKKHTTIGGEIIEKIRQKMADNALINMAYDVVMFHHERWDGNGYPNRLSGSDIPLSAQIMAIADVYDALGSKRPYKQPLSHDTIRNIILSEKGRQFSPKIVEAFQEFLEEQA